MYMAGVPAHIVQRGNNRNACFHSDDDYRIYKEWLSDACRRYAVELYAYVLMTNHVHLLLAPESKEGISLVMQSIGRRYVQYVNKTYRRTGTLWESRHKSSLIQAEEHLLTCYRYIELNPVRAGMVEQPGDYPWSSYRHHAYGERDSLISSHPLYLSLGNDEDRLHAYRELFCSGMEPTQVQSIRSAVYFSMPLGNDRFRRQIEQALGRTIGFSARGRPRRSQKQ
jgi:putative transposase